MSLYEEVKRWRVPNTALPDCLREMAPEGQKGNEGIVLWLGAVVNGVASVRHLIALRGRGIRKAPDQIHIQPDLFNQVSLVAESQELVLVGQIHSHPGTYIDLSYVDIKYGVSSPYYLSLVAPHYAQDPRTTWSQCGIHVCDPKNGFRRLGAAEVAERIAFTDNGIPLTCIGT